MIGLAMLTGWPPDVVRALTLAEVGAISDVMRDRKRAQARRQRKGR